MPKFCNNGHQMEDAWPECPYCQRTGFQRAGLNEGLDKTRMESSVPEAGAVVPAAPDARKTVLLSTLHRSPVVGWLVAMNGQHKGQDFRLREGQNIIGSGSGVEVALNDPAVSAKHASIRYRDGVFSLTDLDSTNGTFLNDGTEAIGREELKDNDLIRIGEVALKFKCL
jgi:Inner membrane component of T3SS, cytoplasmic domain